MDCIASASFLSCSGASSYLTQNRQAGMVAFPASVACSLSVQMKGVIDFVGGSFYPVGSEREVPVFHALNEWVSK